MTKSWKNRERFKPQTALLAKQSILVIEDNDDARGLFKLILEQGGFEVFTAPNGMEALRLLSQLSHPDLILLDMHLGDMTGAELLILLEEKEPDIVKMVPVVFMTGMGVTPISKAVGFIRKPVGVDKLIEAAHHFIETGTGSPENHH